MEITHKEILEGIKQNKEKNGIDRGQEYKDHLSNMKRRKIKPKTAPKPRKIWCNRERKYILESEITEQWKDENVADGFNYVK